MVAAMNSYQYRPLIKKDGMRLFELQPAASLTEVASGLLLHTTLKSCCAEVIDHFTALSYVWGDPLDLATIIVDGKPLSVTKTLETALRHLRDTKRVIRVWADAICINQQDLIERGTQVKQMGSIYQAAHHTIIFLGVADKNTNLVFKWIDHPAALSDTSHGFLSQHIDPLLTLPWFYRVWVFQELILSSDPRVQWGERRCPWDDFFRFFEAYYQITLAVPPKSISIIPSILGTAAPSSIRSAHIKFRAVIEQMQVARERYQIKSHQMKFDSARESLARIMADDENRLQGAEHDYEYKDTLASFVDILVSRRGFGVSDPRDMIFAHTGLVHNLNIGTPNYKYSIEHVFEDLARHHMFSTKSYEILSFVETAEPNERRHGLPSWVPDWTLANPGPPVRIMHHTQSVYQKSENGTGLNWSSAPLSSRVYVDQWLRFPKYHSAQKADGDLNLFWSTGYVTHVIRDLSPVLEDADITPLESKYKAGQHNQPSVVENWDESDYEHIYLQWQRRLGSKNYMLPFIKGTIWQLWQPPAAAEFKNALQTPEFTAQSPAVHLIRCYHKKRPVTTIVHGRRLATLRGLSLQSQEPVMAFVPPTAKIGDSVCFLRACPVPFILRKFLPESKETLDSKVCRVAAEEDVAPPRSRVKKMGPSGSLSSRSTGIYNNDWVVEHFKLVGECFVEGLMYGLAQDIPKTQIYGSRIIIVLH